MLQQFNKVNNPPNVPLLVWDGECKFCRYWVTRFKKITGCKVSYASLQKVASQFPEVPKKEFREAVKLIEPSGNVCSGAAAVLKTLDYAQNRLSLFSFYKKNKFLRRISDLFYEKISDNRPFAYKVTVALWGKNPSSPKPYWLLYIVSFIVTITWLQRKTIAIRASNYLRHF